MNQLTLNLFAIGVFMMTLSVLLGPLLNIPSAFPAIAVATILVFGTFDVVSFEGKGGNLFLDWVAGFSSAHRERVIRHEAGHFLVAQLLGIAVTDYSVSAWEAIRKGFSGQGGVQFDTSELDDELVAGRISSQWLDRFCTVWMAGIAAEQLVYTTAEGGGDDRTKFRIVLSKIPGIDMVQKERSALLQAKTLIEDNQEAFDRLVVAMTARSAVEDCVGALESGDRV
jgi:hypothetical protein